MTRQYLDLARIYGAVDQSRANEAQLEAQRMQQEQFRYQQQRQMKQDGLQDSLRLAGTDAIEMDENGKPKFNRDKYIQRLLNVDAGEALKAQDSFAKQDADAAKNKREESKAELERKNATRTYLRDRIAGIRDQTSLDAVLAEAVELEAPELAKALGTTYNPEVIRSQLLTADEYLKQSKPDYQKVDLGGKIQIIDMNPMTNPSVKGMNLSKVATIGEQETSRHNRVQESNSAETLAETKRKNSLEGGQGKAPSGYRFNPDGTLSAIPGGPGDKTLNPTEVQGKAALYSSRALEADKILNDLAEGGTKYPGQIKLAAGSIPLVGGALSTGVNMLPSEIGGPSGAQQRVEQAQRNFVNAVLRQESGAAIGESEFNNARKQYFPEPGDTPTTIKQKAENRKTAISGLNTMAGPLKTNVQENYLPKDTPMPETKKSQQGKIPQKASKLKKNADGSFNYGY